MSTIMIALVGDQPMPNIIAALQHDPRPDVLYLLHTGNGFRRVAQNTRQVLISLGFKDNQVKLKKIPAYDTARIRNVCRELAKKAGQDGHMVFNTTGGTKLMSLAASQVAGELAAAGQPEIWSLYVESGQRQIIYLGPQDFHPVRIHLRDLRVEHYLKAHGVSIQRKREGKLLDRTPEAKMLPPELREAARYLAKGATWNYRAMGLLRHWLGSVRGQYSDTPVPLPRRSYADLAAEIERLKWPSVPEEEFLRLLRDLSAPEHSVFHLVEHSNGEVELGITGRQCKFIEGDWLEFYVFHEVLRTDFDDQRMGLRIQWQDRWRRLEDEREVTGEADGTSPRNELDVAALQGAQLTICSCKSGRLTGEYGRQALYQLETIARSVGLYCGKVLAAARPKAARDVSEYLIRRALILGIVPVTAEELPRIGEIMANPDGHLRRMRDRF